MLNKIRIAIKQKGQGIIEYAVLLAFIVGLAMMLNGTNLGGAVKGVFDDVAGILNGEEKPVAAIDWGKMDPDTDFSDANQAERYAADQKALVNLANFFMDKTKDDIKALLNGYDKENHPDGFDNTSDVLGWFVKDSNGDMHFLTKYLTADDNDSPYSGVNSFTMIDSDNAFKYSWNDRIFNWMQGDKGEDGYNLSYTPSYNYLVSDYATAQFNRTDYNWTQQEFNKTKETNYKAEGGNGLKVKFGYDGKGKVNAVRVMIDQGSRDTNGTSSSYSKEKSNGLEVTLKRGGEPEYTNVGYDGKW